MPASPAQAPSDAPRLPSPDDAAAFGELCADIAVLHAPADAVEAHWVEEIAFAMWRQRRLRGLESAALDHAESTDEPGPSRFAPLATLARYRARVGRDLRLAAAALEAAQRCRPGPPAVTSDDEIGTIEPEPGPARATAARTGAPPAAVRPRTHEPDTPAVSPLNRRQRRRLEALTRRSAA